MRVEKAIDSEVREFNHECNHIYVGKGRVALLLKMRQTAMTASLIIFIMAITACKEAEK